MGIWMWLSHYLSWKKRFFFCLEHEWIMTFPYFPMILGMSDHPNWQILGQPPTSHGEASMDPSPWFFFSQSSTVPSMKLRIGGTITIRYRNIVLHTQNMYNIYIYINLQLVNFIHIWLICRNFMVKSLWSMFICPGNLGLADCTAWSGLEGCTHYILLEMDLPKLLPIHRYSCFIHRHT